MTSLRTELGTDAGGLALRAAPGPDPSSSPPSPSRSRHRRGRHWPIVVVAVAAVAAGTWAIIGSLVVTPELTANYDEAVYLVQADALARGRLFPPAPTPSGSFAPWFAIERDGVFMFKYTPVHAALLAAGQLVFGTPRASLGALAGAAVLLAYLLAKEVLRDRRLAALASVLLLASPLFLIQSMTFLPYVSNLVLLLLFATAFLRGLRRGRAALLCAGLALGLSVFARPFDAVVFAGPLLLWSVIQHRRLPKLLMTRLGWVAAGAIAPLAALLWFNDRVMGSPFQLVFSLLDPLDKIGFGNRRMILSSEPFAYTPDVAVRTLVEYVKLFAVWCAGGVVLLGLAASGLRRSTGAQRAIAATAFSVPVGYLFFWGPAYITWMRSTLGPFYYVPVLVPVVIIGARGLGRLAQWSRPITACAVAAMVVASGVVVEGAVRQNRAHTARAALVHQPIRDAYLDNALVFLPAFSLLIPFAFGRNDADFQGPIVWALQRGPDDLAVSDAFPERDLYALQVPEQLGVHGFDGGARARGPERLGLQRLERVRASQLSWEVEAKNPTDRPIVAVEVRFGDGAPRRFILDETSEPGTRYGGTLRIAADSVTFSGRGARTVPADEGTVAAAGVITAAVSAETADGSDSRILARVQIPYRLLGSELDVLAPADPVPGFSELRQGTR